MKTNETYLDLKTLSSRTCLSVRTLRDYLRDGYHPLSHYKLAGKILVSWQEFQRWLSRYKVESACDVDDIIRSVYEDRL